VNRGVRIAIDVVGERLQLKRIILNTTSSTNARMTVGVVLTAAIRSAERKTREQRETSIITKENNFHRYETELRVCVPHFCTVIVAASREIHGNTVGVRVFQCIANILLLNTFKISLTTFCSILNRIVAGLEQFAFFRPFSET